MIPSHSDGLASSDADSLFRAMAQLRERMRLQEAELDNLRTTTRFLHQMNEAGPLNSGSGTPVADQSIVDRISRLETRSAEHSNTVQQILAVLTRTDTNLQRVVAELDRLLASTVVARPVQSAAPEVTPLPETSEQPEELAPAVSTIVTSDNHPFPPPPPADFEALDEDEDESPRTGWKGSLVGLAVIIGLLVGAVFVIRHARHVAALSNDASAGSVFSPMERARVFENEKKYAEAESIYRDILRRDPRNADAIRHLASVFFREGKIEESSVVLKQLAVNGNSE